MWCKTNQNAIIIIIRINEEEIFLCFWGLVPEEVNTIITGNSRGFQKVNAIDQTDPQEVFYWSFQYNHHNSPHLKIYFSLSIFSIHPNYYCTVFWMMSNIEQFKETIFFFEFKIITVHHSRKRKTFFFLFFPFLSLFLQFGCYLFQSTFKWKYSILEIIFQMSTETDYASEGINGPIFSDHRVLLPSEHLLHS